MWSLCCACSSSSYWPKELRNASWRTQSLTCVPFLEGLILSFLISFMHSAGAWPTFIYGLIIPLCLPSCISYSSKWMELHQPNDYKLDVAGIPPLSYMPTLVFHFLMQQGKQLEQLFKTCLIQALYFVFLCVAARLSLFLPESAVLWLIWR